MTTAKKKLAILTLLGLSIVGVGVFQFASSKSGKSAPSPFRSQGSGDASGNAQIVAQNGAEEDPVKALYSFPLSRRDPFKVNLSALSAMPSAQQATQQVTPSVKPPANPLNTQIPPFSLNGQIPGVQPGQAFQAPPNFAYSLSGVILGSKPAAVFTDGSGNQRLVVVGGSVDGDSQVLSVSQGKVVVRHQGKIVTLTLGGNPNAQ